MNQESVLNELNETNQPQNRCGFCRQFGHNIHTCQHENVIRLQHNLHVLVNRTVPGGNVDPVLNWLRKLKIKHIRLLAAKHSILVSNSKCVIISKLMDYYFHNHTNPIWREALPSQETLNTRHNARILRIRIVYSYRRFNSTRELTLRHLARLNMDELTGLYQAIERGIAQHNAIAQRQTKKFNILAQRILETFNKDPNDNEDDEEFMCAICLDNIPTNTTVRLDCHHEFCYQCIETTLKTIGRHTDPTCALCRGEIKTMTTHDSHVYQQLRTVLGNDRAS